MQHAATQHHSTFATKKQTTEWDCLEALDSTLPTRRLNMSILQETVGQWFPKGMPQKQQQCAVKNGQDWAPAALALCYRTVSWLVQHCIQDQAH